jgi:phosphoketolase
MPIRPVKRAPLSAAELRSIDAYWRAANYLSVGQIYLYDNPLLRKPQRASTSSRAFSAIGARRRDSTSSTRISIA